MRRMILSVSIIIASVVLAVSLAMLDSASWVPLIAFTMSASWILLIAYATDYTERKREERRNGNQNVSLR